MNKSMQSAVGGGGLAIALVVVATSVAITHSTPSMAQGAETAELAEVIVSARRRDEALIDVPLSISVIDPAQIETRGIQNVTDLLGKVPSLFYAQNRAFSSTRDFQFLVVRGVGANPALEPSVGVFIDGVYQPGLGFDTSFLDVERVELLRGPQGALFGRNTEGGALNIVTRKPSSEVRANVSVHADDLTTVLGRGSLSGPVVDGKLYASISAQGGQTDGYIRNTFLRTDQNAESSSAVRLALRYTPNDNLEVNFTADDSSRRGKSMGVGVPESAGNVYDVAFEFPSDFDTRYSGAAVTIDYDFGDYRLTSQTGYRQVDTQYSLDFDENATQQSNFQFYNGNQSAVSQEFRFASDTDGPLQWLGGIYAYQSKDRSSLVSNWGTFFGSPRADGINETGFDRDGFAVFASASYEAFGGFLDMTAGLRYASEDADATRFSRLTIPAFGLNSQRSTPRSATFSDTSPNLQLTLNWSPTFKTYINVAKGFKTGGWERIPTSTSPFLTLQPETAVNYEIGLKGRALSDRLSFSLAAYKVELEDMHTPTLILNPATGLNAATIASAGKAHSKGFEFDGSLEIVEGLTFSLNGAWTKAEFDEFTDTTGRNRSGNELPNVPEVIGAVSLDYRRPLSNGATFVANAGMRYVSTYFSGLGTPTDIAMEYDSYEVADIDFGVDFEKFRIGIFVKNLADEYVVTSKDLNGTGTAIVRQVAPPRTVGLRAAYEFK